MTEPPGASVPSPCVNLCVLDEQRGRCRGCLRTLAEITGWVRYTDDERRAVLARLARRRDTDQPWAT